MSDFRQLAIIGSTASGKTALSIELAQKQNANILSLDSLSIYKEINIASAKPSVEERENITHFGMDVIFPNESFDVTTFIELYQKAKKKSIEEEKNLVIVGGTSFYLNILLNGISQLPEISTRSKEQSNELLEDLNHAYMTLHTLDKAYMQNIQPTDRYRIEKMLNLYFETGLSPSQYFSENPPVSTITDPLPVYEIEIDREILRQRIQVRTSQMIKAGLIDEVFYLEKHYTREPNCMKAIGIKEVLAYLDGRYSRREMREQIITHTAQLAKRQRTFNNSQFKERILMSIEELRNKLINS